MDVVEYHKVALGLAWIQCGKGRFFTVDLIAETDVIRREVNNLFGHGSVTIRGAWLQTFDSDTVGCFGGPNQAVL